MVHRFSGSEHNARTLSLCLSLTHTCTQVPAAADAAAEKVKG